MAPLRELGMLRQHPPLTALAAPQQAIVEQEEECITNTLMKRLEQLKKEKQVLANEVNGSAELIPALPAARRARR